MKPEEMPSTESGGLSESERFEALVGAHRGKVYGLCYRYAGNAADAEDLTQEVFLRAFRGLPGFRGEANLSTWVYRIAVNVCLELGQLSETARGRAADRSYAGRAAVRPRELEPRGGAPPVA